MAHYNATIDKYLVVLLFVSLCYNIIFALNWRFPSMDLGYFANEPLFSKNIKIHFFLSKFHLLRNGTGNT